MNSEDLYKLTLDLPWRYHLTIQGFCQAEMSDNNFIIGEDGEGWFYGYEERGEVSIVFRGSEEDSIRALLRDAEPLMLPRPELATSYQPPSRSRLVKIAHEGESRES